MDLYVQNNNADVPELGVHIEGGALTDDQVRKIKWLFDNPDVTISEKPSRSARGKTIIGPRRAVETSFSTRMRNICRRIGIEALRIEVSKRYVGNHDAIIAAHLDHMTQEEYPEQVAFEQPKERIPLITFPLGTDPLNALREANRVHKFGIKDHLLSFVLSILEGHEPNDALLGWYSNAVSEHCEHPTIKAPCTIDGVMQPLSIMEMVKEPWEINPGNSLVAFHDGAGVSRGYMTRQLMPENPAAPSNYVLREIRIHNTISAETHNHPSHISPLEGAKTGIGGELRDLIIQGLGALFLGISGSGFCVGNLFMPNYKIAGEVVGGEKSRRYAPARTALIDMVKGVCSYGNEMGRPNVFGFVRMFEQIVDGTRYGWVKPICKSMGNARVANNHVYKRELEPGMLIIGIGGAARRVGVGGGSASSADGGTNSAELDFASVQRGDAIEQAVMFQVIHNLVALGDENPIIFIDDQGAGGVGNLLYELVGKLGGRINLLNVRSADPTLSSKELLIGEYQERVAFVIRKESLSLVQRYAVREGSNIEVLGEITDNGRFVVESADGVIVDVSLKKMHSDKPRMPNNWTTVERNLVPFMIPRDLSIARAVRMVFQNPTVGSKAFIMRIGDRSVSGLVAQQQCVGPLQLPVCDVAVMADSMFGITGSASAVGEQPIKGLVDPVAGGEMAVAEFLTNICSGLITEVPDIKCRLNEMWALTHPGEGARLYRAVEAACRMLKHLKFAANGGKDSMSMKTILDSGEVVVAPGQLSVFGSAPMDDIRKVVTPDLKGNGVLMLLDVGMGKCRMGGSILAQAHDQIGDDVPRVDDIGLFDRMLKAVQQMIREGLITAYHDRSDGGLITTLIEMAISGDRGVTIQAPEMHDTRPFFFNEEIGMVVEIPLDHLDRVRALLRETDIAQHCHELGTSRTRGHRLFKIMQGRKHLMDRSVTELRIWWERTSDRMELDMSNPVTVRQEIASYRWNNGIPYKLTFTPQPIVPVNINVLRPKVGVLRAEGSNGVREMAAMWYMAGFDVIDISMNDVLQGRISSFDHLVGLAPPGGFADGDVPSSAGGWAAPVVFDERIKEMFRRFFERSDTFSLGICNGAQFMTLIGLNILPDFPEEDQPRLLSNYSRRFEARWVGEEIQQSRALIFKGMEGAILGVHSSHAEGRFASRNRSVFAELNRRKLIVAKYVDHTGKPTEVYPLNPNGSPLGIAGICDPSGQHVLTMSHIERTALTWQWHDRPAILDDLGLASPWLQVAHNARALFA